MNQGLSESLGEEMYEAHKIGQDLPLAFEPGDAVRPELSDVKELITKMTSYRPGDRSSALEVQEILRTTRSKVKQLTISNKKQVVQTAIDVC